MTKSQRVLRLLGTALGCLCCLGGARAESGSCDLVALSGTGTVLPGLTIKGTETLTLVDSGRQIAVQFTAVPLGTVEIDPTTGASTSIYSHEFRSVGRRALLFTTIDEIKTVPLGQDPTCGQNPCGLVFRLKLVEGRGQYNCGEIVSGYNPDPAATIPFTSYSDTDGSVTFSSRGKLCKCSGSN